MKSRLIKNTFIVLITSLIIRLLSLFNRIILTRSLGEEGISLYSVILPTIMLFMSISCFSLNTAMVKVTATNKNKTVIKKGITLAVITSSIASLILLLILNILTNNLLKQPNAYYPIIFSIPLFYLTSISSVLRGFLNGIEKIFTTSIANLLEQLSRIIFTLLIFINIKNGSTNIYVCYAVIAMSIGEIISIIFTSINIKKINIESNNINNDISKELLEIAIPTTFTSLSSNFTFFLEPILYTFILSKLSFSTSQILYKFSEVTAYSLPLITLFAFISISISTVIMPKISTSTNDQIKLYINKLITICLIPAFLLTTILFHYCNDLSMLLYNSQMGVTLIRKYVWFFIIFYLISPFNTILQSTNQANKVFLLSLIVHIIKLILILLLPFITTDALIISYLISYLLTFSIQYIILYKQYQFKLPLKKITIFILITVVINCIAIIFCYLKINFIISIILISIIYLILTYSFIKRNNI